MNESAFVNPIQCLSALDQDVTYIFGKNLVSVRGQVVKLTTEPEDLVFQEA